MRTSFEPESLAALTQRWAGTTVLVVGDVMLDEWRFAESERLCREAPAPVLALQGSMTAPGGAGNAAVNLAALGGRPTLIAPVGADSAGEAVRRCLDERGVADSTVSLPGYATPVKRRLLAGGQILVREDEGDPDGRFPANGHDRLIAALEHAISETPDSVLCVCDYGLGGLDGPVREWLVGNRDRFGTVALDAHDLRLWGALAPTLVTPSFAEAARVWGIPSRAGARLDTVRDRIGELAEFTGARLLAVTLDNDGAVVADRAGRQHRTYTDPAPSSHAVGAGDAYLAAFTLAVTAGASLTAAAEVAQLAAAVTVSDVGTCVCDREALVAATGPTAPDTASKVVDAARLTEAVTERRRRGARVVFTNGCFDVLHRGHVAYLEQGRRLGDLLIVAVNSDDSVRRLKGSSRPVNRAEDRAAVLAALSCVDLVVVFGQDSPAELIEAVRPDVYVKGGDYPPELVPEAPLVHRLGGEVRTLGYVPDRSTSAIIDRIRSRHGRLAVADSSVDGFADGRETSR